MMGHLIFVLAVTVGQLESTQNGGGGNGLSTSIVDIGIEPCVIDHDIAGEFFTSPTVPKRDLEEADLAVATSTDLSLVNESTLASFKITAPCGPVVVFDQIDISVASSMRLLKKAGPGSYEVVQTPVTFLNVGINEDGTLQIPPFHLQRISGDPIVDGFQISIVDQLAREDCCGDPCADDPDPCCGDSDPCCGDSDPCCGDPDPCCGDPDPCCGEPDYDCCVQCGDGNECTDDICLPDGGCEYEWKCDEPSDDPCVLKHCVQDTGECVTRDKCDDELECTTDSCDPMTGDCTNEWPCDEPTDPCKERVCEGDQCVIQDKDCDDENECTTGDYCDQDTGECVNEWPPDCEEPTDPCKERGCEDGECVEVDKDCDDGDPCTDDYCEAGFGCVNENFCDDENGCTEDTCLGEGCTHVWTCDDGDDCTADFCVDRECVHEPIPECCNDNDPCTIDILLPDGSCEYREKCDDEDPCTRNLCNNGNCYFPQRCDDGNPCTTDWCDDDGGCHYFTHCPPSNDPCLTRDCTDGCDYIETDCDDMNLCTTDACDSATGDCVHTWNCPEPTDPCEERTCDDQGNCDYQEKDCDDDNECTEDACDPVTGECHHEWNCPEPDDKCDVQVCIEGECEYEPKDCDDDDPCTIDTCDSETGHCVYEPLCPEEDPCFEPVCIEGVCYEEFKCNDEDPCTIDTCDSDGICYNDPKDCNDEDACTYDSCNPETGNCEYEPVICDDENCCTSDSCDPDTGDCEYPPVSGGASVSIGGDLCANIDDDGDPDGPDGFNLVVDGALDLQQDVKTLSVSASGWNSECEGHSMVLRFAGYPEIESPGLARVFDSYSVDATSYTIPHNWYYGYAITLDPEDASSWDLAIEGVYPGNIKVIAEHYCGGFLLGTDEIETAVPLGLITYPQMLTPKDGVEADPAGYIADQQQVQMGLAAGPMNDQVEMTISFDTDGLPVYRLLGTLPDGSFDLGDQVSQLTWQLPEDFDAFIAERSNFVAVGDGMTHTPSITVSMGGAGCASDLIIHSLTPKITAIESPDARSEDPLASTASLEEFRWGNPGLYLSASPEARASDAVRVRASWDPATPALYEMPSMRLTMRRYEQYPFQGQEYDVATMIDVYDDIDMESSVSMSLRGTTDESWARQIWSSNLVEPYEEDGVDPHEVIFYVKGSEDGGSYGNRDLELNVSPDYRGWSMQASYDQLVSATVVEAIRMFAERITPTKDGTTTNGSPDNSFLEVEQVVTAQVILRSSPVLIPLEGGEVWMDVPAEVPGYDYGHVPPPQILGVTSERRTVSGYSDFDQPIFSSGGYSALTNEWGLVSALVLTPTVPADLHPHAPTNDYADSTGVPIIAGLGSLEGSDQYLTIEVTQTQTVVQQITSMGVSSSEISDHTYLEPNEALGYLWPPVGRDIISDFVDTAETAIMVTRIVGTVAVAKVQTSAKDVVRKCVDSFGSVAMGPAWPAFKTQFINAGHDPCELWFLAFGFYTGALDGMVKWGQDFAADLQFMGEVAWQLAKLQTAGPQRLLKVLADIAQSEEVHSFSEQVWYRTLQGQQIGTAITLELVDEVTPLAQAALAKLDKLLTEFGTLVEAYLFNHAEVNAEWEASGISDYVFHNNKLSSTATGFARHVFGANVGPDTMKGKAYALSFVIGIPVGYVVTEIAVDVVLGTLTQGVWVGIRAGVKAGTTAARLGRGFFTAVKVGVRRGAGAGGQAVAQKAAARLRWFGGLSNETVALTPGAKPRHADAGEWSHVDPQVLARRQELYDKLGDNGSTEWVETLGEVLDAKGFSNEEIAGVLDDYAIRFVRALDDADFTPDEIAGFSAELAQKFKLLAERDLGPAYFFGDPDRFEDATHTLFRQANVAEDKGLQAQLDQLLRELEQAEPGYADSFQNLDDAAHEGLLKTVRCQ